MYDISCQSGLTELFENLQECDIIKDKIDIDRKNYIITLKVHNDFIVKTDLSCQKTYINGNFYYDIEEQDLLACYCGFVTDNCIYVMYNKRRLLSFIGLSNRCFKTLTDKNKISKLKNKNCVCMIFTNTELIYKAF